MIEIHHLRESRSRRITWLLEELGLDYTVVSYNRLPSRLAPPELQQVHPLGKAPVMKDLATGIVLVESGAILEYLVSEYGAGKFVPQSKTPAYYRYLQFMHYAEGSAMTPLLLKLYVGKLGEAGAPLHPRIQSEIATHFGFLNAELEGRDFFVGDELTAADVQLCFPIQAVVRSAGPAAFPNLTRFVAAMEARPAYKLAVEKHGE